MVKKSKLQMNADQRRFKHERESVYQEAVVIALEACGLRADREFGLEARFRGQVVGVFKADLLIDGCVIVELKALKALGPSHQAQTLNYLRAGVASNNLLSSA